MKISSFIVSACRSAILVACIIQSLGAEENNLVASAKPDAVIPESLLHHVLQKSPEIENVTIASMIEGAKKDEEMQDVGLGDPLDIPEKELTDTALLSKKDAFQRDEWEIENPDDLVELNFRDTELSNFIAWIEKLFNITFILDDAIKPTPKDRSILGTKITFKTQMPITKRQVGDVFDSFLDISGLARARGPVAKTYRIFSTTNPSFSINKAQLPIYIGVVPSLLPTSDVRIRYVYFVQNTGLKVIKDIIDAMKSVTAPNIIEFPDLNALLITDKASNIHSMLSVIRELDKVNLPETVAILRLKHSDARQIAALYNDLVKEEAQAGNRLIGGKKNNKNLLFSETTRVIPEPRTNSLILLGTRDSIRQIEAFVMQHLDKRDEGSYLPVHVHRLKFADAVAVETILNDMLKFGPNDDAAKYGGVRAGDQYFRKGYVSIVAEKTTNTIVITASHDDYQKLYDLMLDIDVEQPQVAIKVMILNVDLTDDKGLGVQLRDRSEKVFIDGTTALPGHDGMFGKNVNFQTSGLFVSPTFSGSPVVENPDNVPAQGSGAVRLLGDLVRLATNATLGGTTLLTFGNDAFGVWGILQALERITRVSVVANPFLVATHKTTAQVEISDIRRVQTATIVGLNQTKTIGDLAARLAVKVTPQISYDGMIGLDVYVTLQQFLSADSSDANTQNGNRTEKTIKTKVLLADNEILALGGLIKDSVEEVQTKVPILGDIPLLGWLFKNKGKRTIRQSLVILIAPEIIPIHSSRAADHLTNMKIRDAKDTIRGMERSSERRDPVHRWFFKDLSYTSTKVIDEFVQTNKDYTDDDKRQEEKNEEISSSQRGEKKRPARRPKLAEMMRSPV